MNRRAFLSVPFALAAARAGAEVRYADVSPESVPEFPRDHGSHPEFRTEWWYITAWTRDSADDRDLGVQITFFRNRPGVAESGTSRFAPRQLLFAHAAIADPRAARLQHDQRAARAGLGLAEAATTTTDVHIGDWSLRLDGNTYKARIPARDFDLDLAFTAQSPPLLQGDRGTSRKGPRAAAGKPLLQPAASGRRRHHCDGRVDRRMCAARPGSITNGRAITWRPTRVDGIGSASISTTDRR